MEFGVIFGAGSGIGVKEQNMSSIEIVQAEIQEVKAKIERAEAKLAQAEVANNDTDISYYRARLLNLQAELRNLQEKENLLLQQTGASKVQSFQLIQLYRWVPNVKETETLFPQNGFGRYRLPRDRVVKLVRSKVSKQTKDQGQFIYLSGCRGMGKTSLLQLLAKDFEEDGYEVYFFPSSSEISSSINLEFFQYLNENRSKKIAVLIDEFASNPECSGLTVRLLKGDYPNLVTIGAAVPQVIASGTTAMFGSRLRMSDLVLLKDDEDFSQLVGFWKSRRPDLGSVEGICDSLLLHCGGHVYPTLALMEYFFTDPAIGAETLQSIDAFEKFLKSPEFFQRSVYSIITKRCFGNIDGPIVESYTRVKRCLDETYADLERMSTIGWWNESTESFISKFLENFMMFRAKVPEGRAEDIRYLDIKNSPLVNAEIAITQGLSSMSSLDFKCLSTRNSPVRIENAVSYNWAIQVKTNVPNDHLTFQDRAPGDLTGFVDFYLNGFADCAIEVLLNATQTKDPQSKGGSQDIDLHLEPFTSGSYTNWKNFCLLNFVTKDNKMISDDPSEKLPVPILPRDESHHEQVFTYIRSTNTLFKGRTPIKTPAVMGLPCPLPLDRQKSLYRNYYQNKRSFSTFSLRNDFRFLFSHLRFRSFRLNFVSK